MSLSGASFKLRRIGRGPPRCAGTYDSHRKMASYVVVCMYVCRRRARYYST